MRPGLIWSVRDFQTRLHFCLRLHFRIHDSILDNHRITPHITMADSDNDCSDGKPFAVETNHSYDVKRGRRVSPRESVRTKRKPTEHESDVSLVEDDESEDDDRCSGRSSGGDTCAVEINQVCEVTPGRRVSPRESVRKKKTPTEYESDV